VRSRLPRGTLDVVWHDRRAQTGTVIFIANRRPRALTDRWFGEQIPRWRKRGVARDLRVYGAGE
jgi:hypothetical protein